MVRASSRPMPRYPKQGFLPGEVDSPDTALDDRVGACAVVTVQPGLVW